MGESDCGLKMANQEVSAIRSELNAIRTTVGWISELYSIRKEVEAIRAEKDQLVAKGSAAAPAKSEPAKAAPKPEPVKEQPKEAPKPEPVKEQPKPAAAPVKSEPAKAAPKPEPVKEQPKPAAGSSANVDLSKQQWAGGLLSREAEQFYNDVRSGNAGISWVVLEYVNNNRVGVAASGTGGIDDIRSQFAANETGFAYARVATGDAESKRTKFVLITWCGEKASMMRKAKMSVHKADVKNVFNQFAVEIQTSDLEDLTQENVRNIVVKAGGANYNGQSS